MKIRIVSGDGIAGTTQLIDADTGKEIRGISKVELELSGEAGGYWIARLTTCYPVSVDITAEVEEVFHQCPTCSSMMEYIQLTDHLNVHDGMYWYCHDCGYVGSSKEK